MCVRERLTQFSGHRGGYESVGTVDEDPGEAEHHDVPGEAGVVHWNPLHQQETIVDLCNY